jgi:prepilin-type N-terminal cleavage/methylation domain-containing protein
MNKMKKFFCKRNVSRRAFTLVELLVVIAIIGVLAALLLTITARMKQKQMIARTQAELAQVATAIDSYKLKTGFYPPDNPGNPVINPLYFELSGTTFAKNIYTTLDGSGRISQKDLLVFFGPKVTGFMNTTRGGNGDDAPIATKFLQNLRPNQIAQWGFPDVKTNNAMLVCSIAWPANLPPSSWPVPTGAGLNPWRYVSSSPTNNPNSYDLWVDIIIAGKTNRISNWSSRPQTP